VADTGIRYNGIKPQQHKTGRGDDSMFHIPEQIARSFDPDKNWERFFKHLISSEACMNNRMTRYYDWEPQPLISMAEAEQFIEHEIGMVKIELDDFSRELLQERLCRCPGMQYVCTYTYPTLDVRDRLATEKEIQNNILSEKWFAQHRKNCLKNIEKTGDPDGERQAMIDEEDRAAHMNRYGLMHVLCDREGYFSDADIHGPVPKAVQCSMYHVLGKAPIPDEVFVWTWYLQFLIDIGYINDFVPNITAV